LKNGKGNFQSAERRKGGHPPARTEGGPCLSRIIPRLETRRANVEGGSPLRNRVCLQKKGRKRGYPVSAYLTVRRLNFKKKGGGKRSDKGRGDSYGKAVCCQKGEGGPFIASMTIGNKFEEQKGGKKGHFGRKWEKKTQGAMNKKKKPEVGTSLSGRRYNNPIYLRKKRLEHNSAKKTLKQEGSAVAGSWLPWKGEKRREPRGRNDPKSWGKKMLERGKKKPPGKKKEAVLPTKRRATCSGKETIFEKRKAAS